MEFIQTVVDQLEDAAVFVEKVETRQVRIGFILVDNAGELWLLKQAMWLAAGEAWGLDHEAQKRIKKAQRPVERYFGEKLKVVGRNHPSLQTQLTVLGICHDMRNELYHSGLVRPEILRPLARAHFHAVVDLLEVLPPTGYSSRDPKREREWLARYGVDAGTSVLSGAMDRITSALRSRVSPVMPELAGALASYVDVRVGEVLAGLTFLAENGNSLASQASALSHAQFYEGLLQEKFPEVVANQGTPAFFKAVNDARAAFQPKVTTGHVTGWATRAGRLADQTDEHALIKAWSDIERELRPIEDLVADSVFALEQHFDRARD